MSLNRTEARKAARAMISGNPYRSKADDKYINTIADILVRYPVSIALACTDGARGVATETSFMPTAADVTAWCEKRYGPQRQEMAREKRVEAQLQARDEWLNEPRSPEFIARCQAWLDRTDPRSAELIENQQTEECERKRGGLASMEKANRAVFLRECEAAGIDPSNGVSPSLLKRLGVGNAKVADTSTDQ